MKTSLIMNNKEITGLTLRGWALVSATGQFK